MSFSSESGTLEFGVEEESQSDVVDRELSEVVENLRKAHPDCDRLGEIQAAAMYCKQKLADYVANDDDNPKVLKQAYMDKLVQLGLEKQTLEEKEVGRRDIEVKGHIFVVQATRGRHNPCCEVCMHTIWRLVQTWRRCSVCGLRSHDQCSRDVERICAGKVASSKDFNIELELCHEKGLALQNYQCAECRKPLAYEDAAVKEPRLCEYTGLLFCPNCHWGDKWSIPARMLINMDATPRPVCRAVKQLLSIVDSRPLLDITHVSPLVVKFHKELKRVQQLRRSFLYMKCYFVSCRSARKLCILQHLHKHQHFVENSDMFSIQEIRDLCNGTLLPQLEDIYTIFKRHIEEECLTCQGNGFFCELCDNSSNSQIIFPFTENTTVCNQCFAAFHSKCFELHSSICPRCERRKKRTPLSPDSPEMN